MDSEDVVKQVIRILTALAAEGAYLGLVVYFLYLTWAAAAGSPPALSTVQTGAAAALAVALGAGYALALGVEPKQDFKLAGNVTIPPWVLKVTLGLGIFGYFLAGAGCCVTYALNEGETPTIVKVIATGFGGYVIAYLAQAYQDAFKK